MVGIQEELKQNKPFRSKAIEAAVALMRTADLIRRSATAVLAPSDLTIQQYNVLRILRGAGDCGLPTLDIADRMIEETPGITRLIDRLEGKGLVSRERCQTDRRQVFCRITAAGLQLLETLDAPMTASEEEALSALRDDELSQLISLLDRSREGLNQALINQRARQRPQSRRAS